jgi:hypothetical protein
MFFGIANSSSVERTLSFTMIAMFFLKTCLLRAVEAWSPDYGLLFMRRT